MENFSGQLKKYKVTILSLIHISAFCAEQKAQHPRGADSLGKDGSQRRAGNKMCIRDRVMGVVGESGSGKSQEAYSIMGLLPVSYTHLDVYKRQHAM